MRNLLALLLVGLIVACPLFCEAAGSDQALHQCRPGTTCDDDRVPEPSPCSDDGAHCICSGAIQAAGVRTPDHDLTPLPSPIHFALPALDMRRPLSLHLAWDCAATGLVPFGDSGAVCALLQVYRC